MAPAARGADAFALNLRHLRVLCAVADAGSVARAADRLYRVPSAVARSVAELEAALGVSLFERRSRGMVATPQADVVLARARRIERLFDAARQQLMARAGVRAAPDAPTLFATMFNGRRLAAIAGLVERRHMPTVAREVGLTQPAVSAALTALEARLGTPLFERSARGLVPTPAGEIVALHFGRMLAELRHITADLAAATGTLAGSIHVGALPLGRTRILPTAIGALLARHPGLHVATDESPYETLAARLRSGALDFILGALRSPAEAAELDQEALFEDRLSVIARADHPLAGAGHLDADTLHRASWVLSRPGSPSRELIDAAFAAAGQPPLVPSVETGDLAVLRVLLQRSDLLTAISAHQLGHEIGDGSLVVLDFALAGTLRRIGLAQRRGALASPGAEALMAEIRRVAALEARGC